MPSESFPSWLLSHGVDASCLTWPLACASGRSVGLARAARAGSVVLRVPERAMLTPSRCIAALGAWLRGFLPSALAEGRDELLLALMLLHERGGEGGAWAPYVAALPPASDYSDLLCEWSAAELAELADDDAAECALARSALLDEELEGVVAALDRACEASPEAGARAIAEDVARGLSLPPLAQRPGDWRAPVRSAFRWAVHSVASRAFLSGLDVDPQFLPLGGGARGSGDALLTLVMVPMADMFNHHAGASWAAAPDGTPAQADVAGSALRTRGNGGSLAGGECADRVGGSEFGSSEVGSSMRLGGGPLVLDAEWHGAGEEEGGEAGCYILRIPPAAEGEGEGGSGDGPSSGRLFPAGCELALSYGERSGRDLLETYGFLPPLWENPHECVVIELAAAGVLPPVLGEDSAPESGGAVGAPREDAAPESGGAACAAWRGPSEPAPSALALAARRTLHEALGGASGLELAMPPLESPPGGAGGGGLAPRAVPIAQPSPDALALLRALALEEGCALELLRGAGGGRGPPAGGPAAGLWRIRPARLSSPISRDNELAALRLLVGLLGGCALGGGGAGGAAGRARGAEGGEQRATALPGCGGASDEQRANALPDCGGASDEQRATALAEWLARALQADMLALALLGGGGAPGAPLSPSALALLGGGGAPGAAAPPPATGSPLPPASTVPPPPPAARRALAARHRLSRRSLLLAHALYCAGMLGVAAGRPRAGTELAARLNRALAAAAASIAALLAAPPRPRALLEVQRPWAEALLSGAKAVETRGYPLPEALRGRPCAILASPPEGGLARHGLQAGALLGVVNFGACTRYADERAFEADAARHAVPKGHAQFGWQAQDAVFAWEVSSVWALPTPLPMHLREEDRWVRSVFRM